MTPDNQAPIVGIAPIVEHTVSIARTYFERAMRIYAEAISGTLASPDLLQEVLTNLNLGFSNLLGNQWTDSDKSAYSNRRQTLIDDLRKKKASNEEIHSLKERYPKIEKGRTFALSTLIKAGYPIGKGWDLSEEKPHLFQDVMELYNYCKDIAEHTERAKAITALSLSMDRVRGYVDSAKGLVRWFLEHFYGPEVPLHAREQFSAIFGEPYC